MELPIRRQPPALPVQRAREPYASVVNRTAWATRLNQCCDDEETCWIGTWCPFLLSGRTAAQFHVVSSMLYFGFSCVYWGLMITALVTGSGGFLIFLAVSGCCIWPFIQAHTRHTIRGKLGIGGNFCQDYMLHCCCCTHSCALCQEAREAKAAGLPMVDLCSGEVLPDLSALAPNTDLVDGSNMTPDPTVHKMNDGDRLDDTLATSSMSSTITSDATAMDGVWMSMTYISKMGRFVLLFEALIFLASVAILFAVGRVNAVLILCMVFVQPLAILYYFYWRKQRDTVQLDAIIKLFATGFFVTTFQSWVFEQLIETVGIILFAPWIARALNGPGTVDDDTPLEVTVDDATANTAVGRKAEDLASALVSHVFSMAEKGSISGGLATMWQHIAALIGLNESDSIFPHITSVLRGRTDAGAGSPAGDDATTENSIQAVVGRNWFAVFLACFFMAFCVAAAVEETLKQFIVRCHRFATPMSDPYTVTTYLMAGALGFTTCENMLYVFNSGQSPVPGTSIFVGEMMVLLLRVCLPVHLICSVLQGANLSRIVMGKLPNMTLLSMIFSAIVLHGTFDCTLFVMSMIAFANNIDGFWFDVLTYALALFIAGAGAMYAYRQWKKVTNDFDHGWHQVAAGSTHNILAEDEIRMR